MSHLQALELMDLAGPSRNADKMSSSSSTAIDRPNKRLRTGCHSCRIRKKRCDEGKPDCANCTRLGIQCLGYGAKRPEWLKDKKDIEKTAAELKVKVSEGRAKRPRPSPPIPTSSNGFASSSTSVEPETSDPFNFIHPPEHSGSGYPPQNHEIVPIQSQHYKPYEAVAVPDYSAGTSLPIDRDLDEMWRVLFGNDNPFSIHVPYSLSATVPGSIIDEDSPNRYLHHYLNIVLPMQFHHKSMGLGDSVAQLAMTHPDILDAVSSLAALHMGAQRTRQLCAPTDNDVIYAQAAHRKTIDRLRMIAVEEFPTEQIIILAIFATSFQLFSGGTAKMWREAIAVCQRCLFTILSRVHEFPNIRQYPDWMPHLIWVDVVSSISKNTTSRMLGTYRKLLLHKPVDPTDPGEAVLLEKTMGCDSTTTLALAEIVGLSEWKAKAVDAGCLVSKDLLERARPIGQLLEEREWREGHLQTLEIKDQLYGDTFYYAAKILLASAIDGPFPSIPDISLAVQNMKDTLQRLDDIVHDVDLARGLVLPITIAGCHAGTASEEAFFKERFSRLSSEAAAFGNTGSALELMEEVFRRRGRSKRSERVDWTQVMLDMGWEAGILLI